MATFVVSRPKDAFGATAAAGAASLTDEIAADSGAAVSHSWGSDISVASFAVHANAEKFSLRSNVMGTLFDTQAEAMEHARYLTTGDGS